MRTRPTKSVRMMPLALLLATLVVGLGAGALVAAAPAHAGPAAGPFAPMQSLQALLAAQQAHLTAADGAAGDSFGLSVAISGDTAVVGAQNDTVGANLWQGSAYVFVRSGTTWSQQAHLTAADGAAGDYFGISVAVSGDTAVVGAKSDSVGANAEQGSAYVFVRSGTTWSLQQKLTASDGAADEWFGYSVALSGDTAVVGAIYDTVGTNGNQGSAYVFVRSGTTWSEQQKLTALDGATGDGFGSSVAISGDTAVVGAENDTVGASLWQGSAYVFTRSGTTWSQQAQLAASDGAIGDYFGVSVAISGDTAVVGANRDDIAGEDQGSAYVFGRSGTSWTLEKKLTAADGAGLDSFGRSVAVSGDTAVVGAYNDDIGDYDYGQGSAYVFGRSGTIWSQQQKLTAADGYAGDHFGYSVAIDGDSVLVGAPGDAVGSYADDQGSANVFLPTPGKPIAKSPKGLISSRTPTFKWTVAAGAITYQVRVYKGARLIQRKTGITKLSWKCTRRLPRGVYLTWKVRAVNEGGVGPWSAKPRFKVR